MKTNKNLKRWASMSICAAVLGMLCNQASAQSVPETMSFAAHLSDADGPLDELVNVHIELFDAETGGDSLWMETHIDVTADRGLVELQLGSTDPQKRFDAELLDGASMFLEITVNGETMSPRVPLLSVPYAVRAARASVADKLGTLSVTDLQQRVGGSCASDEAISGIKVGARLEVTVEKVADFCGVDFGEALHLAVAVFNRGGTVPEALVEAGALFVFPSSLLRVIPPFGERTQRRPQIRRSSGSPRSPPR